MHDSTPISLLENSVCTISHALINFLLAGAEQSSTSEHSCHTDTVFLLTSTPIEPFLPHAGVVQTPRNRFNHSMMPLRSKLNLETCDKISAICCVSDITQICLIYLYLSLIGTAFPKKWLNLFIPVLFFLEEGCAITLNGGIQQLSVEVVVIA